MLGLTEFPCVYLDATHLGKNATRIFYDIGSVATTKIPIHAVNCSELGRVSVSKSG